MNKLALSIYLGATMMAASGVLLVYGGILIWTENALKGGIVNLLAGALAPIPTYVYFASFSQPDLLGWLGLSGSLLLAPAVLSGVMSIYASQSVSR